VVYDTVQSGRRVPKLRRNIGIPLTTLKKKNSVALVREGTIPTERPPLVGEVSANFCGKRVSRGERNGFPRSLISVF
jgi:hypothetical protein